MEFRWFCITILHGTFILSLTLGMEDFETLMCSSNSDCSPSVKDCTLVRCDCPDPYSNCNATYSCDSSSCILYKLLNGISCCDVIPTPFNNITYLNVIHIEVFPVGPNPPDTLTKLMVWSQRADASNNEWKLIRATLINSQYPTPPTTVVVSDSGRNTLTSIMETPVNNTSLLTGLDFVKDNAGICFRKLNCSADINIACECNQCVLRSLLSKMKCEEYPSGNSFQGYVVLGMGSHKANNMKENYNVLTSSNMQSQLHNHSNSIDEFNEGTFGGWIPSIGSTDHWVKYTNLDTSVKICGVVIQGVAADKLRSLDEFQVYITENNLDVMISYNSTDKTFMAGAVLDSRSVHYFENPVVPDSLKIKVLQPTSTSQIGFRSGLITCTVDIVYCGTQEECLQKELDKSFETYNIEDDINPEKIAKLVDALVKSVLRNTTIYPNTTLTVVVDGVVVVIVGETSADLKDKGILLPPVQAKAGNTDKDDVLKIKLLPESFKGFPANQNITLVLVISKQNESDGEKQTVVVPDSKDSTSYLSSSIIILTAYGENGTQFPLNYVQYRVATKNFTLEDTMEGSYSCMFFNESESNWTESAKWKGTGCKMEQVTHLSDKNCVCDHSTSYAILFKVVDTQYSEFWENLLSIITYVGCAISTVGLLTALTLYFLLRSHISAARYAIHSNLMISLLLSILIFVSLLDMAKSTLVLCDVVQFSLHYLYTASFCWMLCEGFHLYRQIVTVFQSEKNHSWVYYVIGWVLPLVSVFTAVICIKVIKIDSTATRNVCWYVPGTIGSFLFVGPLILIMVFNSAVLFRVSIIVVRAAKLQAEKDTSEKVCQVKAGIRSSLLLMPLLGVTFALALLLPLRSPTIEFIFNIVNSLQGFFIALFYCLMNTEVKNAIAQRIRRSKDASTIQGSTTGLKSEIKSKGMFSAKNKVSPATQFTFTEPTHSD